MATTNDVNFPPADTKRMWEIFVPTERPDHHKAKHKNKFFRKRYHKVWDKRVQKYGGLTIMPKVKGQWVSPAGEVIAEEMIPVRIIATEHEIDQIIAFTIGYYDQEAVLCYEISNNVKLVYRDSFE